MKRDILRRVEAMEEAEAELFEEEEDYTRKDKANAKIASDAYDEDEIGVAASSMSRIRVLGDGESDAESAGFGAESEPLDPETLIEQAYLRDPTVFNRVPNTRRGKARIELRRLTGWADEQLEGWNIMLERTVGGSLYFIL